MQIDWYNPTLGTPIVTVASYGLTFNKAAISELKNAPHVRLGYVKDQNWIVVQPADEEQEGTIPFESKRRNDYIRVNTRDFIKFVTRFSELNLDKSVRIPAYWDQQAGVLIVDLQKAEDDTEETEEGIKSKSEDEIDAAVEEETSP